MMRWNVSGMQYNGMHACRAAAYLGALNLRVIASRKLALNLQTHEFFKTCLQELYVSSTKRQKMSISRSIVEAVRSLNPAGRFLERDPSTGLWSDIGHKKAVEKTSQALRDGASDLRKQLSTDLRDPDFLNAVFDMDFDRGDQKLENQDSEKGEGSDREKGFDEDDSNMEEDSNDKDKETIRVSDRAKYAKVSWNALFSACFSLFRRPGSSFSPYSPLSCFLSDEAAASEEGASKSQV
jgi:hypothetical protein